MLLLLPLIASTPKHGYSHGECLKNPDAVLGLNAFSFPQNTTALFLQRQPRLRHLSRKGEEAFVCLYCSAEPQNHEGNTWPSVHVLMGIILMYCMVRSSLLPSRRQLFLIVRLLRNIKWNNVHLALLKSFIEHNDKVF